MTVEAPLLGLFFIFIYLQHSAESQANPISANALNLRDASNTREQIYKRSPVLDAGGKTGGPGKSTEASLDWNSNAYKCRNRGSNPGLIGAKAKEDTLYANLLPLRYAT